MALAFHHDSHAAGAPHGVLWSSRRAHLAVVAPSSPPAVSPALYRRRRLAVGAVTAGIALLLAFVVAAVADRPIGQPLEWPQAPTASMSSWITADDGVLRYVVAEGDSLWGIARQLEGVVAHRQLVERFVAVNGSARIVPGQVLEIQP